MGHRRGTTALAWSLFALWAAIAVAATWLDAKQPHNDEGIFALFLVGYATVGALVASRHPSNAVGWLLIAIALTTSLQGAGEVYVSTRSNPGYVAVAWVTGWLFNVWLVLAVAVLPLVFPDGRLLSPRWRKVLWYDVTVLVLGIVVVGLKPGDLDVNASIDNPLAVHGAALTVVKALEQFVSPPLVVGMVLAAVSLALRFRRSVGVERQQLKWFAFAGLSAIGGFLTAAAGAFVSPDSGNVVGDLGWWVFMLGIAFGIPLATGIAILRYRLYDIDVVINRTLVYVTLTATLVVMYVVSILLLRLVLSSVTGKSDLAVAGSTLAVAAVFRPARSRIQGVVDRRFYRRRYDAVHTLEEFSTRLRHELDLDAVGTDLCATADQTLQPAHVSLWLREAGR